MRTTFTTKEEAEETTATLEAQYENTERSQYLKYDDTRRVLSHLFDHTNGVNPSTTPGYSIRLNGSDNERNGIARSLSVMPGDKIDMQVFGKYYDPNTPQTNQTAWDNLVGLITQVANAAQTVVVDGVGYTSGSLRIPPATGVLTDPNESAAYPKAHLNWATFDRDWKFLDGGAKQLQGGAEDGTDVPFAEISKSIEIKEPGYVYIWLSNTSAQQRDVFFDDFKVVHTKSPVVQQEEYYPYGLSFNEYTRENSLLNNYKYNGKELQDELNLGLYDYIARQYDPLLGRFTSVDPAAELMRRHSPYNYAFDNPLRFIDPDGNVPFDVTLAGTDKETALTQIQSGVKGITVSMNADGQLSYAVVAGQKQDKAATELVKAIDDHSVDVLINTTSNATSASGKIIVGGAFMGNNVSIDNKDCMQATNEVDTGTSGRIDDAFATPGGVILHEITEAYQGAKNAQKTGITAGDADASPAEYKAAHAAALKQPGGDGGVVDTHYDKNGNMMPPAIDANNRLVAPTNDPNYHGTVTRARGKLIYSTAK